MRSYTTVLFLIVLLLLPIFAFPQIKRSNNWYFGFHVGLNFNNGSPPQVLSDGKTLYAGGTETMSDTLGNLLFYSDGGVIRNREHVIMPNSPYQFGEGVEQAGITIPHPGNSQLYYQFNSGDPENSSTYHYSIVDMSLQGGLGDIDPNNKYIQIADNVIMRATAVYHKDLSSVWLVLHGLNDNRFMSFLIDESGINVPVITNAGPYITDFYTQLKISPNGKKIVINGCILDFDDEFGTVSDAKMVLTNESPSGIEFSPDNTKLYMNLESQGICQYELNAGSPGQILTSREVITNESLKEGNFQLGADGKIYCSTNNQFIGTIGFPNKKGISCNFNKQSLAVAFGTACQDDLPPFIQSYFNDPQFDASSICFGNQTYFKIRNLRDIDSVFWKFNDINNEPNDTSSLFHPYYVFSHPDTFFVDLTVYYGSLKRVTTDTVIILQPSPELGSNTFFCYTAIIDTMLDAGIGDHYIWNGSTNFGPRYFHVTDTGYYSVKVFDDGCIGMDTVYIGRYPEPVLDDNLLSTSDAICSDHTGYIEGISIMGAGPFEYEWKGQSGIMLYDTPDIYNLPAGNYFLWITDAHGCNQLIVEYQIEYIPGPDVSASTMPATTGNANGKVLIIATGTPDITYSLDGSSPQSNGLFTGISYGPHIYVVTDGNGCTVMDTVFVDNINGLKLSAIAGNDEVCRGESHSIPIIVSNFQEVSSFTTTLFYDTSKVTFLGFLAGSINEEFTNLDIEDFPTLQRIVATWIGDSIVNLPDSAILFKLVFKANIPGNTVLNWDEPLTWFSGPNGTIDNVDFSLGNMATSALPKINSHPINEVCIGDPIYLNPSIEGEKPFTYEWIIPDGRISRDSVITIPVSDLSDEGHYQLLVTDNIGCTNSDTIVVALFPYPETKFNGLFDTIWFDTEVANLEAIEGYASYQWSTGDTTYNTEIINDGLYTVVMVSDKGCAITDSAFVMKRLEIPVWIPNAFTPNGDGMNDFFGPVFISEQPKLFSFTIYNRWGQSIFESNNPSHKWNGVNVPAEMYTWVLYYQSNSGKPIKLTGSFMLIR